MYFSFIKTNFGGLTEIHLEPIVDGLGVYGAHRAAFALKRGGEGVVKMIVVKRGKKKKGGKIHGALLRQKANPFSIFGLISTFIKRW